MRPISRESAEAITIGMTENEVEALLGPPGNYASRHVQWVDDFEESMRSWWHVKEWVSDTGLIQVRIGDATGKVLSVEFRDVFPVSDGLLDRVLGWFRRPAATR